MENQKSGQDQNRQNERPGQGGQGGQGGRQGGSDRDRSGTDKNR